MYCLGGSTINQNDIRSTIFYDTNDTAYYTDPQSTSRMNYVKPSRISCQNNGDQGTPRWDFRAYVVESPHIYAPSASATMYVGESNHIHIRSTGQASGDFRAPIFYDSNNTGYYVDPNSFSNMNYIGCGYNPAQSNSIGCSNWFRSSGSSGLYFASYGGGWHMADSTWIRSYNSKQVYMSSNLAVAGNITAYYSDERLKTKTGGIDNALEKVQSLSGFTYVENDLARELGYKNEKQQVGVSAQEVQAVVPEAVSLAAVDIETSEYGGEITSKSGENYLTVDYSRLVPLLIESIKELKSEVDGLKAQLESK